MRALPSHTAYIPLCEVEGFHDVNSLSISLLSRHFSRPVIGRPGSLGLYCAGSHWSEQGCSQITRRFVQSNSPADLSMYKCTVAEIISRIPGPSKVYAPQVTHMKF